MPRPFLVIVLAATSLFGLPREEACAQVVASDNFEASDHPDETRTVVSGGVNGIVFYTHYAGSSSAIGTDATFGSKALSFSDTDTNTGTNGSIIGLLPRTMTLLNVNDYISLSLKARFTNVGDGGGSNFRLGFFSSTGTPVSADNTTASDNDAGYYAVIGANSVPAINLVLFNETGLTSPLLGGTDRAGFTTGTGFNFGNTAVHTVVFTATRTSATLITLSLQVDGGAVLSSSSSANLRTSFDEIAFSTGFGNMASSLTIDDIVVVPEPSSALLVAGGALALMIRRRRPRSSATLSR